MIICSIVTIVRYRSSRPLRNITVERAVKVFARLVRHIINLYQNVVGMRMSGSVIIVTKLYRPVCLILLTTRRSKSANIGNDEYCLLEAYIKINVL